MNRYLLHIFVFYIPTFLSCNLLFSQVKIGDNPESLDANSLLELESSSKVLVVSRISNVEMQSLQPLRGALVFNTDENCVFFYDGNDWASLCTVGGSTSQEIISLTDNGDGSYTFLGTDQQPITFITADDTVSVLEDNLDGTYTYTNELGEETDITFAGGSLEDNGDGSYIFTNSDGSTVNINTATVQETTSTLEDNLNGTYTYTDEEGVETLVDTNSTVEEFTGTAGSVLFAGDDGKVAENNTDIFWYNTNGQLGVKTNAPNSTVSINGSLATAIRFGGGDIGLSDTDHTVIVNSPGTYNLFLPGTAAAKGRMYIIKKIPSVTLNVPSGYVDSNGITQFTIPAGNNIIWLQSDEFSWQQVN